MINRNKTSAQKSLLNHTTRIDPERTRKQLEFLIEKGKRIDLNDFNSVYGWVNSAFAQLESFSSEHLSFRLHCLHTGLTLLSIALEKEDWPGHEASLNDAHVPFYPEQ